MRLGRERVVLHRHGRDVAAIVPLDDLRILEELEDRADVAAARRRLRDRSDEVLEYEQLRAELGLTGREASAGRRLRKGA